MVFADGKIGISIRCRAVQRSRRETEIELSFFEQMKQRLMQPAEPPREEPTVRRSSRLEQKRQIRVDAGLEKTVKLPKYWWLAKTIPMWDKTLIAA
jgi:hypothetical protein